MGRGRAKWIKEVKSYKLSYKINKSWGCRPHMETTVNTKVVERVDLKRYHKKKIFFKLKFFFFFVCLPFLGPHPQLMELPKLGV